MLTDTLARIALAPILIAQALAVRRQAQSLPEAAGPRTGETGAGPPLRLHIIGDSSAAGVGVATQDIALSGQLAAQLSGRYTVTWSLDAITGATTKSTLGRLNDRAPMKIDVAVIALGVNDITRLIPVARWIRSQLQLMDRVRDLYQPRHIYLSGIPPIGEFPLLPNPLRWTLGRQAAAYDLAMRKTAATMTNIRYLPFEVPFDRQMMAPDGFHPGAEAYAIWAERLAAKIIGDL